MGNFCWMCERVRPNEAFSGRNHGRHLCKDCARIPKSERDRNSQVSALWDMLCRQSNISEQNIRMASAWARAGDAELATIARLVADVGRVHPRKKKRLPYIRRNDPDLWRRMIAAGVVEAWPDELSPPEPWVDSTSPERMEQPTPPSRFADEDDDIPFDHDGGST